MTIKYINRPNEELYTFFTIFKNTVPELNKESRQEFNLSIENIFNMLKTKEDIKIIKDPLILENIKFFKFMKILFMKCFPKSLYYYIRYYYRRFYRWLYSISDFFDFYFDYNFLIRFFYKYFKYFGYKKRYLDIDLIKYLIRKWYKMYIRYWYRKYIRYSYRKYIMPFIYFLTTQNVKENKKFNLDIFEKLINFLKKFFKTESLKIQTFVEEEIKDVTGNNWQWGTSGCSPLSNPNVLCVEDFGEKIEKIIKSFIYKIRIVHKKHGIYSLRFYSEKQWKLIQAYVDKRMRRLSDPFWKTSSAFYTTWPNRLIHIMYSLDKMAMGLKSPIIEFLKPQNVWLWAIDNPDKAIIHLAAHIIIVYVYKDFIRENLKKIHKNFLDLLNEIVDYEDKDYKTQLKNGFICIKEIFKTIFDFIPLILKAYFLGHLLEPFRVYFLANEGVKLYYDNVYKHNFYSSKYYHFRFQYYTKLLRLNLFIMNNIAYLENLGILKTSSPCFGQSELYTWILSFFASIIAPWRLKDTNFSSNISLFEALRDIEANKYDYRQLDEMMRRYSKFFSKDDPSNLFEYLAVKYHALNHDLVELLNSGLAYFGTLPSSNYNKITKEEGL